MKKDKMKLAGLLLAIACTSALGAGAVVASGTATATSVTASAETNYAMSSVAALSASTASVIQAYSTVETEKPAVNSWEHTFTFVEGSGRGFLYNGAAHTGWKMKQPGRDMYIELGKEAAVGDYVIIDGTFYSSAADASLTFSAKFQWNGTKWVNYVEYNTYTITSISPYAAGCNEKSIQVILTGDKELPAGDWDNRYTFEEGSGTGLTLGETTLTTTDIKYTPAFYVGLGTTAVEGDVLTIDGTYYNAKTANKFVFVNCQIKYTEGKWVAVEKEPEVVYTEYQISTLIPNNNSNGTNAAATAATALYMSREDGVKLPYASWDAKFTLESGAWKLNGNDISLGNLVCAGEGLYIGLGSANVKAGDVLTVSGTFVWEAEKVKLVIAESSFIWTGSVWTKYAEPITYEIGKLAIDGGSSATAVNFKKASGEAFEAKDGTWTEKLYFIAGTGVGVTINGTQINMSDIKIPNNMYVGLKTTAVAGDELVIGGTFFNGNLAVKYVVEESTFVFDGTAWAEKAEEAPAPEYNVVNVGTVAPYTGKSGTGRVYLQPADTTVTWSGASENFLYESGTGFKILRGEEVIEENKAQIANRNDNGDKDFYITTSATLQAGDKAVFGGTYYNEPNLMKYVFTDTEMWWNGTAWQLEKYEATPETYTEINVGKLVLGSQSNTAGSAHNQRIYTKSTGDALVTIDGVEEYNTTYVSGTQVLFNGEACAYSRSNVVGAGKYFYFKITIGGKEVGANVGDKVTIGGVFVNEEYKIKYTIEDTDFWWNGSTWQTEEYQEPAAPTVYEIGALAVHNHSSGATTNTPKATQLYMKRADGQAIPYPDANWETEFVLESGAGWKVNGQAVTVSDIESTNSGLFVNLADANVQPGDVLTVGGTFYCDSENAKYVITDTAFMWTGSIWTVYAEPTTYEIGKVAIDGGSKATAINFKKASGAAFEATDGTWAEKLYFISGTGVGVTINGTQISMGDIKIPNNMYVGLGTTAVAGDVLVIGGAFYNAKLAVKYVIEESTFTFDGENWVEVKPEVVYTTYTATKVGATRDSSAMQVFLYALEGDAFPKDQASWDLVYTFETGSGVGLKLNDTALTTTDIKLPGDFFVALGATAQAGDILTIDGTYYNEEKAIKIAFVNCQVQFDGEKWGEVKEEEPEVEYTEYQISTLIPNNNSNGTNAAATAATALYMMREDGQAMPIVDGTWSAIFTLESGDGWKLNGNSVTVGNFVSADAGLYINLDAAKVQPGDVLSVSGTFVYEAGAAKYVITESKFIWTGTVWTKYVEPTTYEIGKLAIDGGSSATAVNFKKASGEGFEAVDGTWAEKLYFISGTGVGVTFNGTALKVNDCKIPGNIYLSLEGNTAVEGDELVIGGTFFNGNLAVKYVIEESTFVFDGTNWVAKVEEEPEVPDVPVIEYTTYNITKLGVTGTQAAEAIYVYSPENEIPKDKGDWDNRYTFEAGSGAGVTLNGTAVSEIKMPGDLYVVLGRMPVAGDILTFDGTIYNETKAIKLVFANLQLEFDGEKWGEVKQDEPEVEYTVHELGTVIANRNSNGTNASATAASCLYMSREDGLSLPYASWDAKFALESGAWKLNGNDISVGNLVCSNEGLYIGLSSANVQAGDILTVSGTFVWAAENAKLVIAESSFIWTGSVWTKYTTAPTTYEIGKLAIDGGSSATAVNFKKANGEAFEAKDGTWTEKLYFISGTGAGMTLNGTQINGKDFKIPNNIYLGLGTTAKAGDVLVIGGTFFNGTLAVQYVVEESTFVFDGTAWVAKDNDTPAEPELPEVEFTTYTITKIGVAGTQAAEALNVYTLEGDGLPKSEGDWDAVYTFAANSGKGVLLNGVALTAQIKMPNDLYVTLGKMPTEGDILTIDGILYNEAKAHKFVFVNCQLEFDGEKWVEYTGSDTPDQPDTPVDPSGWTTVQLGTLLVHPHSSGATANAPKATALYIKSSSVTDYPVNDWHAYFNLTSGDGWKLNGNDVTVGSLISADKHLYVNLKDANVQVGDKLTVSGTFAYEEGKVQYVIEESTFIWNGTTWENYVEYTEYELGTLKFRMWTTGSNHIYLYGADDPRDGSIPKPGDGNDGWTATFKWKDGIGIQINGQDVSASVKYPGEIFIAFSKAPAVGDILTVGGTFYNPELMIAYIVDETSFTWDGTTWVEVVDYTEYEVGALTTLGTQALAGSIDLKKADNGSFEANGSFKFLGGSGIGIAMNGEAIETKQIAILGNMMTFSIAPNANEGDVLTIGGTFYNVENAVKYIIEESSFIYENGTWSVYESNYNEIGLGEVIVLADASDAQYIYLASKDDTLELPVNSWEAEFVPTFGLGVTLNGQVVEGAVILSVDNSIYLELPSEAQDGDILVIGGKFVCEAEGVLYFVKNTQFTWNADEAAWEGVINYNTMEVGKLKLYGNSNSATAGKSDRIHFKASSALVLEDFTLALESGIGFTVNGEQREFTMKNLKDGNGYLYFTFEGVEEGDVVTIGGTFYNKEMAVKYVIEESTFIWENGAWSIIYEKVNVGPVIIITTTTSRQDLYLAPANGKTFPASGWEDPLYYVSGAGITVDGVEINMNNTVKVPDIGTIFVRLTGTADGVAEGAVVVIGGVFRCPTSGIEYTIEESTFVYANGAWSNQLDTVKSETVAALDEYFATFTEGDYYETEWTLLTEIVTTAKAAIKSEISKFAVEELFANAKANMDAVATKAAWDAESDQIKAQAKADIESYKNVNEYRDDDKAVIAATVAEALAGIDAATDWATMNNIVKHAKAVMDALWTAAEWDAAEAVVAAAKAELESYKSEADYFVEEWATIQTIIANANANIDALIGSTASIENVVNDAKAKMDAVKTMEQVIADEAVVNAAKDELAGYKAQADYNEPEWNEIQTILAKAYANIDDSIGDAETIANIVADAKAKMDKVLKSEAANKKAFDDAKATAEAAIRELANSINYDEYSEEAANEISGYLAAAVEAIEAVTEKEDFAKIVDDVTAKIASVQKLAVADDNEVSILDKVKQAVGCSSVVGLTTSVTMMAAAAAIVLNKKKED